MFLDVVAAGRVCGAQLTAGVCVACELTLTRAVAIAFPAPSPAPRKAAFPAACSPGSSSAPPPGAERPQPASHPAGRPGSGLLGLSVFLTLGLCFPKACDKVLYHNSQGAWTWP